MSSGVRAQFEEGLTALGDYHDVAPTVTATTRALRMVRAEQLDEVHAVVADSRFYKLGDKSPSAWLATTSRESFGQCNITLRLADRIQKMPLVKQTFSAGDLAESALRLLVDAWSETVADVFARDEAILCGWAQTLSNRDLKTVLAVWVRQADPDQGDLSDEEKFEARALHLSSMLDGIGRLDGQLDPEGFAIVQETIRALSQPAPGDTRTAAQRMACDCDIHRLITGPQGTILDYGRKERVVSDPLFDAIAIRDGGCRIDGCGTPAGGCDAHHAVHWLQDGETEQDNLALVCWYHHRWLHNSDWDLRPDGNGHFTLLDPDKGEHPVRPPWLGHHPPPEIRPGTQGTRPPRTGSPPGHAGLDGLGSDDEPPPTLFDPPI